MEELKLTLKFNKDMLPKNSYDNLLRGCINIKSIFSDDTDKTPSISTHLIFLLDSSGSMDELASNSTKTKKQMVVNSVKNLINSFKKDDLITIISFNDIATIRANKINASDYQNIENCLKDYLKDTGATDFQRVMDLALRVCSRDTNLNQKIIFLTDGYPTTGDSDKALEICKKLADNGITTDVIGFGGKDTDFNYDFMKKFSDLSSSLTEYAKDEKEVSRIFKEIYKDSSDVAIKKLFINILFEKNIRDVKFFQHYPEQKILSDTINVSSSNTLIQVNCGDIPKNSFKNYLFECTFDTSNQPSMKICTMDISFFSIKQNKNISIKKDIYINLGENEKEIIYDSFVDNLFNDINLLLKATEVNKLLNNKEYAKAAKLLDELKDIAEQQGEIDKANYYNKLKNKIMKGYNVTQDDLNKVSYSSSRPSIASVQAMIEEDEESNEEELEF